MLVHMICNGNQIKAWEAKQSSQSPRLHIEHTRNDKDIQTRTFLMAMQFGTGQFSVLHCLAWICRSAQMRLQTLHPPFALTLHPAPCFSSPFILAQLAELHLVDRHVEACKSNVM